MKRLEALLSGLPFELCHGTIHTEISGIAVHCDAAAPGSAFVCMKGSCLDGHDFWKQAAERGAAVIVMEQGRAAQYLKQVRLAEHLTVIQVPDTREALALMSQAFYDYPARSLVTIGITGTKGKTTCAMMLLQILRCAGYAAGYIGTLGTDPGVGRMEDANEQRNTTPDALSLARSLDGMVKNGCQFAVMEVSSQGLWQKRVHGIHFDFGVFLNLSHDHIGAGEHSNMREYLRAKAMLFRQCMIGVVNLGSEAAEEMIRLATCREMVYFYGKESGCERCVTAGEPYRAEQVRYCRQGGELGSRFFISRMRGQEYVILLPGIFNVENAVAAAVVGKQLGIPETVIAKGLHRARVRGRMENVSFRADFGVYIDYAHNAVSLENVLRMLRTYQPARIICVFGCGGNRSVYRRTEMGRVSGELADLSVITSDNPRMEQPEAIIADIVAGIRETNGSYLCITDRREAIHYTLSIALPGDIVLIAGKGHETYQEIRGVRCAMDDRELVREYECSR